MKTFYILYDKYLDEQKGTITIGGVQTYITELVRLIKENGHHPIVVQFGQSTNQYCIDETDIWTYQIEGKDVFSKLSQTLASDIGEKATEYVVIYATDTIIPSKQYFKNTIAIQHGIYWDKPIPSRSFLHDAISVGKFAYTTAKRISKVNKLVCVDYNFINWFRTQSSTKNTKLYALPNFAKISPVVSKPSNCINIIFARRLWWYRGTRVFVDAIKPILEEYKNVRVTVAGAGPDEQLMKDALKSFSNVSFIEYGSEDSLKIHSDKNIAVVPTIGSEGTSLSLLEAMSCQCACIASNVGGMTNIILDGYNGLLVEAGDSKALYKAIKSLLNNEVLRTKISELGYQTVKEAFSYDRWRAKWEQILFE